MNVKQLERIRSMIKSIRAELETDNSGYYDIAETVGALWEVVTTELKNAVWRQYLEAEG